jgi:hypothetical protein
VGDLHLVAEVSSARPTGVPTGTLTVDRSVQLDFVETRVTIGPTTVQVYVGGV